MPAAGAAARPTPHGRRARSAATLRSCRRHVPDLPATPVTGALTARLADLTAQLIQDGWDVEEPGPSAERPKRRLTQVIL